MRHNSAAWLLRLLLNIYSRFDIHLQTAAVSAFSQLYLIFVIQALADSDALKVNCTREKNILAMSVQ